MNRIPNFLRTHFRIAMVAALAALAPVACMQGTESGTETGLQGLEGGLSREGSQSAAGARVYAFRRAASTNAPNASDSAAVLAALHKPATLEDTVRFRAAVADAEGKYRFTDLPEGDYSVLGIYAETAQKARWAGFEPAVQVRASAITPVGTIPLRKLGGIRAVVASNHKPLEGAVCQIPGVAFVAYTDSEGRCTLDDMPPGTYTIGFEHPGYLPVRRTIAVESEIRNLADTLELVRDPAGAPPQPTGFSASFDERTRIVTLSWDPAEVSDVAGYALYRMPLDSIGTVVKTPLRTRLITGTTWRDTLWRAIPDTLEADFVYRLEAVDIELNASPARALSPLHIAPSADPVRLQFTQSRFTARENDGSATAWVRRTGPLDRPVTLSWQFADSSALRDSDYVPMGSALAFAPGDSLLPVYALLTNDRVVEGPESFAALLTAPGNGAVIGPLSRASIAVQDDDSVTRIVCPKAAYAIGEKDSLVLAITRSGETGRRASFKWETVGGTATSGLDFPAASGTLAFDSGATSLRLPIRITDDTLEEKAERFIIRFSEPSRDADLSRCPDIAVDIADDDSNYVAVPVDFTKAYSSYDAVRPDVSRFPGGIYDGDTLKVGLAERKTSNPALLPKPTVHYDFKDCGLASIPDRSGNGMDARVGGHLDCVTDSAGSWARFDTKDTVILETRPELDFQEGLTVTALVKPDSLAGRRTLIGKTYAPSAFSLEIVDGEYNYYILLEDGTPQGISYTLTTPATAGVWTHVAGTFDGRVMRLYINGEIEGELMITGRLKITARPITIGNWPEWSAYAGGIKEVKLFGQTLNGWQIQEQMILGTFPTRPLSVTFDFAQPIWTQGAGAFLSQALGTTRYAWKLAGADNLADLDGKKGSFVELAGTSPVAPDAWSRAAYKPRRLKTFRFTVTGQAGTGFAQINELSLMGAERIKLQ